MDDHFIQSITNLSDNELQCKLNYLTKAIEREKSLNPYSKENALDSELRVVLHEIGNRRAATSQQTLSFGRRNKGRNLLKSKKTQTKKKATAEAAEATRASLKSDVTTVKPQQVVQESPLTCTSLEPTSTYIERPKKVSKNNADSSASSTSTMSRINPDSSLSFMLSKPTSSPQSSKPSSSSKAMSSTSTSPSRRRKKSDGQASDLFEWNWKEDFTSRKPSSSQRCSAVATQLSSNIDQFMIEERAARRQRDAERESSSKSMSIVTSQSSDGDLARKPDLPLVEPTTTSTVAKQSNSREGFISHEYLASNKGGRRITKKIDVHENAAPVLEASKTRHQDDAQKQVVSLNAIAMRRNSTGKNPEMNNIFSTLLNIAAGNPKFGEFFDANSPRANQIQNVITKHNIKRSELRAFATTANNMVKQFRKSKNNQFLKQSIMQRPDYGGNHNFLQILLKHCRELNIVVVTDGMDITSENAKQKKIYLVHSLLALGNEEACRQLVKQNNTLKSERPDCEHKDCTAAVGTGGGGKYCPDCIPTHCTVSYEDWKRDRYDKMTPNGKSRIKGKSGKKWNETKEDWNGCAAKVTTASGERFLCSGCTKTDNALR